MIKNIIKYIENKTVNDHIELYEIHNNNIIIRTARSYPLVIKTNKKNKLIYRTIYRGIGLYSINDDGEVLIYDKNILIEYYHDFEEKIIRYVN